MDNATPIIIVGIHYGNFFTGQFFTEEPDMEFFKAQAKKYGFNEAKYLDAVKKVPIWTHEKLNSYLYFVKGLITILSESGLKRLKEIETRKQIEDSKELHHTILQTAIDGFWMTDMQGRLVDVNEAYCRMSGYSREELLTMSIPDLEAVETNLVTADHIHKVKTQGEGRFDSLHRRKDGSIFNVEVSVQYRTKDGGVIVGFLRDITERKQAEEMMKKYARELEEANHLKDLFTDIIRHDLLNPVTVIKGLSEILSEEELPHKNRNSVQMIIKNVGKLEEMIQSAASLAKVEAVDKLDFEERDLCEILRKVISDFTPMVRNKGMSVEFFGEGECIAKVNPHIEEFFSNLLSNAVKYGPENTRITVGIKANDEDWMVSVKDRGYRIPNESKEIIFERFKRIEKRGIKGTGLGLSIVKRIVDIHKGKVWVEDNPEGGNIFLVRIPAKRSK